MLLVGESLIPNDKVPKFGNDLFKKKKKSIADGRISRNTIIELCSDSALLHGMKIIKFMLTHWDLSVEGNFVYENHLSKRIISKLLS